MTRIGILGGSFDPVHVGHLRSAIEVRETLGLDRVLLVPVATAPHKRGARSTDARLRLEMLRLALSDAPALEASDVEIERGGVSYTVDTLATLRERLGGADLVLIVGYDMFLDLPTWRDAERIFELASVVVTTRPPVTDVVPSLDHLPVAARETFCYQEGTRTYRHKSGQSLRFVPVTGMDVSSSAIRRVVATGRSIRYLVPHEVERFIVERGLYTMGDADG